MGSRETYPKWKVCEGGSQSRGVSVKWVIHTTVWAIHTDRAGVAEVKRGQGEIWTGGDSRGSSEQHTAEGPESEDGAGQGSGSGDVEDTVREDKS